MNWREFRHGKGTKVQVWKIRQDGEYLYTEHGQLGGAQQNFSDRPGPKGKEGTKAYVDGVANTTFHVEREIRKKLEHGYIEYVDGKPTSEQVTEIRFDRPPPKNFCGYKPQTDIKPEALAKIHKTGKARYTRKYDGMRHSAVHHPTGWEIYTRRMDLASERFPKHIEELSKTDFGVGTLIEGEFVCYDKNDKDKENFKAISSVCRSLPEETRKIIADGLVPEPAFIVFDIMFLNGESLQDKSYDDRAKLIKDRFAPAVRREALLASVDYHDVTPDTWMKIALERDWEGFVFTDGSAVPGNKFFSFDGDAKRPKGHHKLKPVYEDDVVIFAAEVGTGKRLDTIGSLCVKQRHPETGKWFYCGKIGSGLSDQHIKDLEVEFKEHNIKIFSSEKEVEKLDIENDDGLVCMIEYSGRQPKTSKFRFGVFMRRRDDKAAHECVAQRLGPEED
jgi:ATP-dependent DNA ligase